MTETTVRWLIEWTLYINDEDDTSFMEGPYETKAEAEKAAITRYKQVDPWHDGGWELRPVQAVGVFPTWVKTVEPVA